jgi:XTP/dITP diphosphohydrolase
MLESLYHNTENNGTNDAQSLYQWTKIMKKSLSLPPEKLYQSVMKLVFATANPGKVSEASNILGDKYEIITAAQAGIKEDIPEDGETLRANSLQKAQYIYDKCGKDCFADDTGLEVDILGGAPGVHTARYAGEPVNPAANIDKLLKEMERREFEASIMREYGLSTPHATRKARFRTSVTLILNGVKHFFDGIMEGRIARKRHGDGGFGYDPVFIPDGYEVTAADLPKEQKNAISHRGKSLRAMAEFLQSL